MNCLKCSREIFAEDAIFCPYCGKKLKRTSSSKPRLRPNGTGTAYKRGRTWTASVVIGWKPGADHAIPIRRTKGGFSTKREALAYCADLFKQPKKSSTVTMRQVYEAWLNIHVERVGKSTMDCYRAAWKYFSPLHDVPFNLIDLEALQECVNDCPYGKRTKENMKALAGLLMKHALPRHYTDMNYAMFIYTGNEAKSTHPAFTPEQINLVGNLVGIIPYADYVFALIYTGFRPTELFNLRKEDCRDGVLYGGIKTEAGKNRAVPISPRIADIIRERMASNSPWLFPKQDGTQMSSNYFRDQCFYPVLDKAGIQPIPTADSPAYYVPYSCRHTFANLLKNVQGSDKDKAALIGHEDYRTTVRIYQSAELENLKVIMQEL